MRFKVAIAILLHTITHVSFAQIPKNEQEAIKLKTEIHSLKDSPQKVDRIFDIGSYYENKNIDTAIYFNDLALAAAKKIDHKKAYIDYASRQSYLYNLLGDFKKGLEINQMGYDAALALNDKTSQLRTLAGLGISSSYMNEYDKALDYYQRALNLALETKDDLRTAKMYGIMAGTYNNMGYSVSMDSSLFYKAIELGKKALAIGRKLNDSLLISDNLNVIALAYNNLDKIEDALPYATESKVIASEIGLSSNYAEAISKISKYARFKGNYDEAINYAKEALSIHREMGNVMGIIINLKELAICYKYKGDFNNAIKTINEAIELAQKQEMDYILDGMYINKAEYLYGVKQYKDAYDFLLSGQTLADSLRGADIKNKVNELEKKYETAKKEQEILKLTTTQKVNRWIIYILLLAFIAFIIIAFSTYRNIKYKNKIVEQEKEQLKANQKLESTASIIKGQEEERHRLAKDLHDGLGGMLSGLKYTLNNMNDNVVISGQSAKTFDNAIHLLDQAIGEMRKVAHNMMPESLLKFGLDETLKDYISKMNASVPMQTHYQSYNYTKIEQSTEINLYRIIQEAINNAIKHAQATDLYIQMDIQDDQVHITMEDNGIGFDTQDESLMKGIGLKNIADRVNYINGRLEISSNRDKGTLIVIEIKTNAS